MELEYLLLIALGIILIIVIVVVTSFIVEINKKKRELSRLKKTLKELENKLNQQNFRQDHRVEFPATECTFEILQVGQRLFEQSERKKGQGNVLDVSRSGMKLSCRYDLPVRKQIILDLKFMINNHPFSLTGKIVRKEETLKSMIYGIQFLWNDEKVIQQLAQQLHKVEAEKNKQQKKLGKSAEKEIESKQGRPLLKLN